MIGRANRFHGYNSLRYTYQHGQTVRGPLMSLRFCKNGKRSDYRLAVVVSKKVSKSAVQRNRMRRRIYEIVRRQTVTEPYDLVLTVFSDTVAQIPAPELEHKVVDLLSQARVIIKTKEP